MVLLREKQLQSAIPNVDIALRILSHSSYFQMPPEKDHFLVGHY
uniref:Uncharacterized protein n=1 Tax=Anguilla anguilla TaxID=7936 RepID=A0A0E9US18_ANGAN